MSPELRCNTQCQVNVQRQRCRPRQASICQEGRGGNGVGMAGVVKGVAGDESNDLGASRSFFEKKKKYTT